MSNAKQGFLISAAPMYEDGSIGDHVETEFVNAEDAADNGGVWLIDKANAYIGQWNSSGDVRCDAIDVTISKTTIDN